MSNILALDQASRVTGYSVFKNGNFYKYVRKAQKIFEKDFGFKEKVGIKKQLSNNWQILHKFLERLKK